MTHTELGSTAVPDSSVARARPRARESDPLMGREGSAIVLGFSKDPHPKTTLLLFGSGTATPWGAAKLARSDTARRAIARESAFLVEIHRVFSDPVLRTVPRRLTAFESVLPDGSMLVEALAGTPLSVVYARRKQLRQPTAVRADLTMVSAWLQDLHAATTDGYGSIGFGVPILAGLRGRFGSDPMMARTTRALAPAAESLALRRGPKTVVHGDLWLGNVLVDDGAVTGVVDWENAQLVGEPLRDIARFALTYALYIDRRTPSGRRIRGHQIEAGPWGIGVTYVLAGTGWFPELIRGFVCAAISRLGGDPTSWRDVLLLGLADIAATTDDDEFAYRHLVLLDQLTKTTA